MPAPNERLDCTTCYGTGLTNEEATHDRQSVYQIVSEMLDNPGPGGIYPTSEAYARLEAYVNEVRYQAIGWCWSYACNLHDQGLDPRTQPVPEVYERAKADLNPIADKERR